MFGRPCILYVLVFCEEENTWILCSCGRWPCCSVGEGAQRGLSSSFREGERVRGWEVCSGWRDAAVCSGRSCCSSSIRQWLLHTHTEAYNVTLFCSLWERRKDQSIMTVWWKNNSPYILPPSALPAFIPMRGDYCSRSSSCSPLFSEVLYRSSFICVSMHEHLGVRLCSFPACNVHSDPVNSESKHLCVSVFLSTDQLIIIIIPLSYTDPNPSHLPCLLLFCCWYIWKRGRG